MTSRKREDTGNWKSSRLHSVESWLRKRLWTCLNRGYMMMLCYWIILHVLLPNHSGTCFYWIILTYAMLPSHSDICYVTELFWHRLLPNHSDMLLPSHSDICHVTKSFWHMLCYQTDVCFISFFYSPEKKWHVLCYMLLIHFGIIWSDMFMSVALMQGSVWYEKKMRKVVMKRGSRWQ